MRESYGRNIYGQSVLLARRLIEAGTRVACISWAPDANATWDTHGNNFAKLKNELLPQFDAALSSLLTDLSDRGMLERTLVVVMGEFGRSPKVNGGAGRDHWNFCYSLLLAGGGIKAGLRPRRQRQDRRPSQPAAGDAGRHHRHDLRMPGRAAGPGVAGSAVAAVRAGAVGIADPGIVSCDRGELALSRSLPFPHFHPRHAHVIAAQLAAVDRFAVALDAVL